MTLGRPDPLESQCDMPYCYEEYSENGQTAMLGGRDGKTIMAFCDKHAQILKSEGICLRTMSEVRASLKEMEEVTKKAQKEWGIRNVQADFIRNLKMGNSVVGD